MYLSAFAELPQLVVSMWELRFHGGKCQPSINVCHMFCDPKASLHATSPLPIAAVRHAVCTPITPDLHLSSPWGAPSLQPCSVVLPPHCRSLLHPRCCSQSLLPFPHPCCSPPPRSSPAPHCTPPQITPRVSVAVTVWRGTKWTKQQWGLTTRARRRSTTHRKVITPS